MATKLTPLPEQCCYNCKFRTEDSYCSLIESTFGIKHKVPDRHYCKLYQSKIKVESKVVSIASSKPFVRIVREQ